MATPTIIVPGGGDARHMLSIYGGGTQQTMNGSGFTQTAPITFGGTPNVAIDTDSGWSLVNSEYTVVTAGLWLVLFNFTEDYHSNVATSQAYVQTNIAGGGYSGSYGPGGLTDPDTSQWGIGYGNVVVVMIPLNVGDKFRGMALSSTGSTVVQNARTYLYAARISA